jgi:hypothetical protein
MKYLKYSKYRAIFMGLETRKIWKGREVDLRFEEWNGMGVEE